MSIIIRTFPRPCPDASCTSSTLANLGNGIQGIIVTPDKVGAITSLTLSDTSAVSTSINHEGLLIKDNTLLTTVNLSNLTLASHTGGAGPNDAAVYIVNNPILSTLDLSSLVTATTDGTPQATIWIINNPALTSLDLHSLVTSTNGVLQGLEISNNSSLLSIDISALTNFPSLFLNDNALTSVTLNPNTNLINSPVNNIISLANNALTSSSVNEAIVRVDGWNQPGIPGNSLFLINGGTNAVPTGLALTAITNLLVKNWLVYVNGNVNITYNTLVGAFQVGELITGPFGTAVVTLDDTISAMTYLLLSGTLSSGDTITGSFSGATAIIN